MRIILMSSDGVKGPRHELAHSYPDMMMILRKLPYHTGKPDNEMAGLCYARKP